MQKHYTDKNLSRLLQKAVGGNIHISDELAVRDKDYMDYTASLNAHDSQQVRDFVRKTNTEPIQFVPRPQNVTSGSMVPTQENLLGG